MKASRAEADVESKSTSTDRVSAPSSPGTGRNPGEPLWWLGWILDWIDRLLPFHDARPLARIGSLKLKFTLVIGAAIAVSMGTVVLGVAAGLHPMWSVAVALLLTIVVVQLLARGITAPLMEMRTVAGRLAAGDYASRVLAPAAGEPTDEVGELARAFNAMAADLAEVNRQREQLIADVSHELRTPMAVLHGSIENLVDGVAEDPRETLEAMRKQAVRLRRLIDQLLDLSRIDAGVHTLHVGEMDLADLLDDVVAATVPPDAVVRVEMQTPERLRIAGDPNRLHQVFTNLVDNALRHGTAAKDAPGRDAPRSGTAPVVPTTIEIAASVVSGMAVVTVADRGPGVPESHLEAIFGRFARVGPDRTSRTGGAGLGLAISAEIVQLHRGHIRADNRAGGGCVITVGLPVDP